MLASGSGLGSSGSGAAFGGLLAAPVALVFEAAVFDFAVTFDDAAGGAGAGDSGLLSSNSGFGSTVSASGSVAAVSRFGGAVSAAAGGRFFFPNTVATSVEDRLSAAGGTVLAFT